jgi:hypothetical protein
MLWGVAVAQDGVVQRLRFQATLVEMVTYQIHFFILAIQLQLRQMEPIPWGLVIVVDAHL